MAGENTAGLQRPIPLTVCRGGLTGSAWVCGRPVASPLATTLGRCPPEERRDLATSLGREGFDKKACTALQSEGLCPFNPETAKSLEALHPRSLPPAVTPLQDLPLAPEIVPELVARCLRAFPAETAPGPTGLRVQHLRDACVAGGTDALLTQLAAVVSLVSQGMAPTTIARVLAGAGLVALPKPSGGVRPIAVGELLRRLVGKCLMASVREEARHYFWHSQVGVGVKGGAEKAVHTVRAWMQRNSSSSQKVLVKLDFANAFNCVSRHALREVAAKFPGLARFATWCYQMPSSLRFGSFTLESQTGVQQGDPLGPLLFAAAIHPLASTLRAQGLDLAIHYFDDGVLAGDLGAVAAALAHVQQQASSMGLVLNLAKCEAVAVGGLCPADLGPHFPAALLCHPDGSPRVLHNFEFLGAAIGDAAFSDAHAARRAEQANRLLEALASLEDSQVGLRLLRSCAGFVRLVHSMRCNPPGVQQHALATFDQMVRTCFGGLTGLHLTASQWQQAGRSLAHAGLGLRSTVQHAPAAYLASLGSSLSACAELDSRFSPVEVLTAPGALDALRSLNSQLDGGSQLCLEKALAFNQHALSARLDTACWEKQLAGASPAERASLWSETGLGARAFLAAVPSGPTRMEKATFVAELRVRLGVPDAPTDAWCPRCDGILDRLSHHAGVCVAGGERAQRHYAVRDVVHAWAEKAGLRPEKERPGLLLPQSPDDTQSARRRPADVFLPALAGGPAALDFAITAHQRQDTLALASSRAGAAAEAYDRQKEAHLHTAQACASQGVSFVPMVVETTGHWDVGAARVLRHIATAVAARTGDLADHVHTSMLQELCVVVRSFRARAALRRRSELADA